MKIIAFGVFILVVLGPLAYLMFGVSSIWFWGTIVVCGLIILWGIRSEREGSRIVECRNCHRQMTYERWEKTGGCPKCGTDLYDIPRAK